MACDALGSVSRARPADPTPRLRAQFPCVLPPLLRQGVIHVLVPSPNEEGEVEPAFRRLLADAIDFIPPLSSYRPPPLGAIRRGARSARRRAVAAP